MLLAPYYVTRSRVECRPTVEIWPLQLADPLPVLPVPLLEPDPSVALYLGAAVSGLYERAGYAELIDYCRPPPKLPEPDEVWVDERLQK